VSQHNLEMTLALLARTPATLDALFRDLPDAWTGSSEGGDTWSAFDVVGHLLHTERMDWMGRVKTILEFGDSQPFAPVDRFAQLRENQDKTVGELLDAFARSRSENLAELRRMQLTSADLARRGKHSALGSVTLSELLAAWAGHDLTHLHQISRILAHQYRDAVGPWKDFLGVLRCAGHSS